MKCTGEPVKSFSVHDFFLKQDEADVYWHVYSLLALREKSWTEKLFTGSPVHFTVPISPVRTTISDFMDYIVIFFSKFRLTYHLKQKTSLTVHLYFMSGTFKYLSKSFPKSRSF